VLDAANFQHRVEDAASVIQRKFRKRLAASSREETANSSQSSVENEEEEEATGKEQKTDEGGEDDDDNDENLITAVFLAMFAVGMSLFKVLSKCMQQMDDTGGAIDMSTHTGTPQAAPQTIPVPQPPP
jgi:hypothetical protein